MNHYLHVKADDAAEAIENYISMHNLNPHDRIPSERAMAEELGINRTTCREALKRLENEHILYSIVGSADVLPVVGSCSESVRREFCYAVLWGR